MPSKGFTRGGRHLSFEQSELSKSADMDVPINELPVYGHGDRFAIRQQKERWSELQTREGAKVQQSTTSQHFLALDPTMIYLLLDYLFLPQYSI